METRRQQLGMLPISIEIDQLTDTDNFGRFLGGHIRAEIATYDPDNHQNHIIVLDGPVIQHRIEQIFGPPIRIQQVSNLSRDAGDMIEKLLERGIETLADSDKEKGEKARADLMKLLNQGRKK